MLLTKSTKLNHLKQNIVEVLNTIPSNVKLVAVSKTKPAEDIIEAWNFGLKDFGENRVQELIKKHEAINLPIDWHLIGHLQTNKVKYIIPFVSLIQSVDSFKLLKEINKEAQKINRIVPCLLQVFIAKEETKFGFSFDELEAMLSSNEFIELKNISVSGLMGMATYTENTKQVSKEFKSLYQVFDTLKTQYFSNQIQFKEISMGMSGDYKIAIQEGSTIVRIGSLLFGGR